MNPASFPKRTPSSRRYVNLTYLPALTDLGRGWPGLWRDGSLAQDRERALVARCPAGRTGHSSRRFVNTSSTDCVGGGFVWETLTERRIGLDVLTYLSHHSLSLPPESSSRAFPLDPSPPYRGSFPGHGFSPMPAMCHKWGRTFFPWDRPSRRPRQTRHDRPGRARARRRPEPQPPASSRPRANVPAGLANLGVPDER